MSREPQTQVWNVVREIERLARVAMDHGATAADLFRAVQRGSDGWYEDRYAAACEEDEARR